MWQPKCVYPSSVASFIGSLVRAGFSVSNRVSEGTIHLGTLKEYL